MEYTTTLIEGEYTNGIDILISHNRTVRGLTRIYFGTSNDIPAAR